MPTTALPDPSPRLSNDSLAKTLGNATLRAFHAQEARDEARTTGSAVELLAAKSELSQAMGDWLYLLTQVKLRLRLPLSRFPAGV